MVQCSCTVWPSVMLAEMALFAQGLAGLSYGRAARSRCAASRKPVAVASQPRQASVIDTPYFSAFGSPAFAGPQTGLIQASPL